MTIKECPYCENKSFKVEQKGTHTGLYCKMCERWIKWIGKKEINYYKNMEESNNEN